MTNKISAIDHAQQMGMLPGVQPTYGYYRQPNGWITCSPATDLEELKYRREQWEPLPQYGRVEMTSAYMADHPLEVLFMYGGEHELPVDQIIQQGLWMNPPLVPSCRTPINQNHKGHRPACWNNAYRLTFPQVPPDTPRYYECRFCEVRKPTEVARNQHEVVMHKDERSDLRTGQSLAESLVKGLKGDAPKPTEASPASPDVLSILAAAGLSKKQIEALRAAGIATPMEEEGHDQPQP